MNNCINLINLSIKNNKKGFIISKNIKNINIIKSFIKLGIVKFVFFRENKLFVFINYNNDKPVFRNITNMYKSGHKLYISYKNLLKLNKKHNWIFILSTSKGIISSNDALRLRIGGLLIAKIWN